MLNIIKHAHESERIDVYECAYLKIDTSSSFNYIRVVHDVNSSTHQAADLILVDLILLDIELLSYNSTYWI